MRCKSNKKRMYVISFLLMVCIPLPVMGEFNPPVNQPPSASITYQNTDWENYNIEYSHTGSELGSIFILGVLDKQAAYSIPQLNPYSQSYTFDGREGIKDQITYIGSVGG